MELIFLAPVLAPAAVQETITAPVAVVVAAPQETSVEYKRNIFGKLRPVGAVVSYKATPYLIQTEATKTCTNCPKK